MISTHVGPPLSLNTTVNNYNSVTFSWSIPQSSTDLIFSYNISVTNEYTTVYFYTTDTNITLNRNKLLNCGYTYCHWNVSATTYNSTNCTVSDLQTFTLMSKPVISENIQVIFDNTTLDLSINFTVRLIISLLQ